MPPVVYRFGPFTLDFGSYRLCRGSDHLDLQPKALEVLRRLVAQPGTLHTKDDLFAAVWPDVAVTDNALTQVISDIRQVLGDRPGAPVYVETVARRGYRFVAAVEVEGSEGSPAGAATPKTMPAMAVLDFDNLAQDTEIDWLGPGIADTVLGDLRAGGAYRMIDPARLRDGRDGGARGRLDAARDAGADLAVTGGFQRAGDRLRINARVIDLASGDVRAEARADGWMGEVFQLQDVVARDLSRALNLPPRSASQRMRQTGSLDAYRAATEGRLLLESLDVTALSAAQARFLQAIAIDPSYAAAHVGLANVRCCLFERERFRRHPPVAVLLQSIGDARRGVELDPGYAEAHATLAYVLTSAGQRDEAKREALRAVAMEPEHWLHHFRLGNATWGEERLASLRRVLELYPEFPFAHLQLAMVDVARGAIDRAGRTLADGLAVQGQGDGSRRFPARGLHWLSGAIALADGRADEALAHFTGELAADRGHLYGEEFATAAGWGEGFALHSLGRHAEAVAAFERALSSDGSGRAALGLAWAARDAGQASRSTQALSSAEQTADIMRSAGRAGQALFLDAARASVEGNDALAVQLLEQAVTREPAGSFGWTLPIEPIFAPLRASGRIAHVLDELARRAR